MVSAVSWLEVLAFYNKKEQQVTTIQYRYWKQVKNTQIDR